MIISSETIKDGRKYLYKCACDDCGVEFLRRTDGRQHEVCKACANKRAGKSRSTHGESNKNSKLHVVWNNMLSRCRNPNNERFLNYGGRGISVCDDWLSYEAFRDWARNNGYREDLTIDRKDNDAGYSPVNCRFVDKSFQNANRGAISTNSSGFVGVWFERGAFCARVVFKRRSINLGRFKHIKLAIEARDFYIRANNLPHKLSGIEGMTAEAIEAINDRAKSNGK